MQPYQIERNEELLQVNRAVEFYSGWADKLRQMPSGNALITHYYRGMLDSTNPATLRFRALFFAMRLQPVLTYVNTFKQRQNRPPHILDLGCGFGLESTLICSTGAVVYGVDAFDTKIQGARELQSHYEKAYGIKLDLSFDTANLFNFTPAQPYDAVYSSATLHHIEPAPRAMEAISQLLKPGGYFFLSDENGLSPVQQLAVQKRIGWFSARKQWRTDVNTGKQFLYGNENIRAPFQWASHMHRADLQPQTLKYCRFLPAVNWPIERLVDTERRLRTIPIISHFGAIGFLLTAYKPE